MQANRQETSERAHLESMRFSQSCDSDPGVKNQTKQQEFDLKSITRSSTNEPSRFDTSLGSGHVCGVVGVFT